MQASKILPESSPEGIRVHPVHLRARFEEDRRRVLVLSEENRLLTQQIQLLLGDLGDIFTAAELRLFEFRLSEFLHGDIDEQVFLESITPKFDLVNPPITLSPIGTARAVGDEFQAMIYKINESLMSFLNRESDEIVKESIPDMSTVIPDRVKGVSIESFNPYKRIANIAAQIADFDVNERLKEDDTAKLRELLISSCPNSSDETTSQLKILASSIISLKNYQTQIAELRAMNELFQRSDPSIIRPHSIRKSPIFALRLHESLHLQRLLVASNPREVARVQEASVDAVRKTHSCFARVESDAHAEIQRLQGTLAKIESDMYIMKTNLQKNTCYKSLRPHGIFQSLEGRELQSRVEQMGIRQKSVRRGSNEEQALSAYLRAYSRFEKAANAAEEAQKKLSKAFSPNIRRITEMATKSIIGNENDIIQDLRESMAVLNNEIERRGYSSIRATFEEIARSKRNKVMQNTEKWTRSPEELKQSISKSQAELMKLTKELIEKSFAQDRARINEAGEDKVNPAFEKAMARYLQMVMCPDCHKERRDRIISVCGHSFCSKCLSKPALKRCPICKERFTKQQLHPLTLV